MFSTAICSITFPLGVVMYRSSLLFSSGKPEIQEYGSQNRNADGHSNRYGNRGTFHVWNAPPVVLGEPGAAAAFALIRALSVIVPTLEIRGTGASGLVESCQTVRGVFFGHVDRHRRSVRTNTFSFDAFVDGGAVFVGGALSGRIEGGVFFSGRIRELTVPRSCAVQQAHDDDDSRHMRDLHGFFFSDLSAHNKCSTRF